MGTRQRRTVYESSGTNLGYLVVEIYAEALTDGINTDRVLGEELLIDTVNFYVSSVTHPEKFGSFKLFPELASLKGDFSNKVVQEGTSIFATTTVPGT